MVKEKTRIKIRDLPRDMKVSREEMRKVVGGAAKLFEEPIMEGIGWHEVGSATHKDSWRGE